MSPAESEQQQHTVEGYRLHWRSSNHHAATLVQSVQQEQSFVDVTLSAQGRSVEVHRLVLSASSPFFKDLLSQHPDPQAIVIILEDIPFTHLGALVEFMYRGEVSVAQEELPAFICTAQSLQIKGLMDQENSRKMNDSEQRKSSDALAESLQHLNQKTATTEAGGVKPNGDPSGLVVTQPSTTISVPPYILGTTTSSITQMLHQPIYTSNLLPNNLLSSQVHGNAGMSNGGTFGTTSSGTSKLETDRQQRGSSVATSENEEWSDADLGPPTPAAHTHTTTAEPVHHQAFVGSTPFPHVSWNESLAAAAAAAVVSSAVGSLVPGPSGIQYLQAATAVAAAAPPPPAATTPARGKQRNSRRPSRQPSVATLIQDKPYVCPRCGRCYSRRGALIQHQRYECGIEPQFSCPMCPYKIKRKDSLNRHIRNMHHNHQSN